MAIYTERTADNVVIITLDAQDKPVNTLNQALIEPFGEAVATLVSDDELTGIVITSAKRDFIAGADLDMLYAMTEVDQAMTMIETFKGILRRLETIGKPVVAAINGTALGGGFEVALACHYRIVINDPKIKLGLPEVKLGILPGGGGTQRLARLLGVKDALPILLEGKEFKPAEALAAGLIHDLAADRTDLLEKALAWIAANPESYQPWDQPGFCWPGGDWRSPEIMQLWAIAPAMLFKRTRGNYPAARNILAAVAEGSKVDFEVASRIESRYFVNALVSQECKNMMSVFWYQLNKINKGESRPAGIPKFSVKKLGILGAGMMGAGIAYVSAYAGIDVVMKDVSLEAAEKGKDYSKKLLNQRARKGKLTKAEGEAFLARIKPTAKVEDLAGCDLIIEAVFEDRDLKAKVIKETEQVIPESAIFASNTSTLPITGLAEFSQRPTKFIGLHFFSPVDKMPLVEIIKGKLTDPETLAKSFDYVQQIRKTPIVVNDSRGFYTSRVFSTYIMEGVALLQEGQEPGSIEAAGVKAGMPVGPLAVTDEVSLALVYHIIEQTKKDFAAEGKSYEAHPGEAAIRKMVVELDRLGRKTGKGFYDYQEKAPKRLWPKLAIHFPQRRDQYEQTEMSKRLLFIQALETVRCFEEGVVTATADANIGSIFGWGFAPFKGGVLQFINDYGVEAFVKETQRLAEAYGSRFQPPNLLLAMAKEGKSFI